MRKDVGSRVVNRIRFYTAPFVGLLRLLYLSRKLSLFVRFFLLESRPEFFIVSINTPPTPLD